MCASFQRITRGRLPKQAAELRSAEFIISSCTDLDPEGGCIQELRLTQPSTRPQ